MTFKELLLHHHACNAAVQWAADKPWADAYATCERGDWLLWLFMRTNPDDVRLRVLVAGHCANTVRHLMKEQRSKDAVDGAIAFGEGRIDKAELELLAGVAGAARTDAHYAAVCAARADATYAAVCAASAVSSDDAAGAAGAAIAAYRATYAAVCAASAAAHYAAFRAAIAASAARAASPDDAYIANQLLTANIVRKHIPIHKFNI